jgi:hypothetical protein
MSNVSRHRNHRRETQMLTDFVVAPVEEVRAVLVAPASARTWPRLQAKSVDPVKLCSLWAIVEGRAVEPEAVATCTQGFAELGAGGPSGPWVAQVPQALVARLAQTSAAQLVSVAKAWAQTEEAKLDGWREQDASETVLRLVELSKVAVSNKRALLLWFSL